MSRLLVSKKKKNDIRLTLAWNPIFLLFLKRKRKGFQESRSWQELWVTGSCFQLSWQLLPSFSFFFKKKKEKGRSKNAITGTVHCLFTLKWTLCPWSSVLNLWPTLLLQSEDVGSKVGWWSPRNPETVVWADSTHGKRKTSAQNTAQDRDFTIRYRPSHRHIAWAPTEYKNSWSLRTVRTVSISSLFPHGH